MLTAKQEKFVRLLVEGYSQRKALEEAYDCSNMNENSRDVKACKLFAEPKIRQRFEELTEELKKNSLWNIKIAQEKLMNFLEMCEKDKDKKHALGYIKELNSLLRLYETESKNEKIEIVVTRHED